MYKCYYVNCGSVQVLLVSVYEVNIRNWPSTTRLSVRVMSIAYNIFY